MNALVDFWRNPEEYLLHVVESDDLSLESNAEAVWFQGVKSVIKDWHWLLPAAVKYYESLFLFNKDKTSSHRQNARNRQSDEKNPEQARLELTRARPTGGNKEAPALKEPEHPPGKIDSFNPETIRPGLVPPRARGRKPIDFFCLFPAFIAVQLMGEEATPEAVRAHLNNNPSLARACGFTPGGDLNPVPSFRLLQQFDQIMSENGIWTWLQIESVKRNLENKIIIPEKNLVHDTTHHLAYSGFETVDREEGTKVVKSSADGDQKQKNKKAKVKSQSHLTKSCRCEDRNTCPHPWELSDDGAGTVVKHGNKMYWGHKSSVVGLPDQGVPLAALAMTDAASHDSQGLPETLRFVERHFPGAMDQLERVLDDSAADGAPLKDSIWDEFGLRLNCSVNAKRKKSLTEDSLPTGMTKLTPAGYLYCQAGHVMDYLGTRRADGTFIYGSPVKNDNETHCEQCPLRSQCCRANNKNGRIVSIPFETLPHISPENPPMAKRFAETMKKRTAVERMIYQLKCRLGERYLHKRGNHNYQATLDKSMIAFHLMLNI